MSFFDSKRSSGAKMNSFFKRSFVMCSLCLLLLPGCFSNDVGPDKIASINIIDRNGMSETISKKERLDAYQKTDFNSPQPYQKVLRVYGRDEEGSIRSCITSYHPNGEIKQSLEAVNNRAFGSYNEWYPNGQIKIISHVIGGTADLNTQAEESWLFEGINQAWNEDGNLIAEISYVKGELSGESKYYHPNGGVWKISPFIKNVLHGQEMVYLSDGTLFQTTQYINGVKEGLSVRHWNADQVAFRESYKKGLLMEAEYLDMEGKEVSRIGNGRGFRALFGKIQMEQLQEFQGGIQEGIVKIFDEGDILLRTYYVKEGEKQGPETDYFSKSINPKLLMTWNKGFLQGPVKTWYDNGNLESLKEMSQNKKNGVSSAWYRNGMLMFVEEYDNDKLIKGEYYKAGEKVPFSKVERGKGFATLFDADGNFAKKINYQDGRPIE